ncbi:MAG: hypothetical protein Q8K75_01825 [Chlamydiales bacterium]|nr:hypothetical protein [Chlamydiales bacterium]
MSRDKLQYWNQVLGHQGYSSRFIPADESVTYSRIIIDLGKDYKERPLVMELKINSYLLPAELKNADDAEDHLEEEQIFQLLVVLPFLVEPRMIGEVARLLLLLNKPLDLPGFGLDEVTRLTYFRHSLLTKKGHLSPRVMLAMVGTIAFLVESLMPQIELVANGSSTKEMLAALVSQITEANLDEDTDLRRTA